MSGHSVMDLLAVPHVYMYRSHIAKADTGAKPFLLATAMLTIPESAKMRRGAAFKAMEYDAAQTGYPSLSTSFQNVSLQMLSKHFTTSNNNSTQC